MKIYLIRSVTGGNIARAFTREISAVEAAKTMPRSGIFNRMEWEVAEIGVDGALEPRIVFSTLDSA